MHRMTRNRARERVGGIVRHWAWRKKGWEETHHVSAQVNAEDGNGTQGQWDVGHDEQQEGSDLRDVAGQGVGNGFLQVVENQTSWWEGDT